MARLFESVCLIAYLLIGISKAFQCTNNRQFINPVKQQRQQRIHTRFPSHLSASLPSDDTNADGAYSNKPNAWGYSRTIVNKRERRRFERRRMRHRMRFFAPDIGRNETTAEFDDGEMDEDGYWGMLGATSKRELMGRLLQNAVNLPKKLFKVGRGRDDLGVEPGTLILVRHGESLWNANKTFTGKNSCSI
jgi:hypothetical protein